MLCHAKWNPDHVRPGHVTPGPGFFLIDMRKPRERDLNARLCTVGPTDETKLNRVVVATAARSAKRGQLCNEQVRADLIERYGAMDPAL
jgi:hypothetical protein